MNKKQTIELCLVTRFLHCLGSETPDLAATDRPDVIAHIDGKRIGIEVTQFHLDETAEAGGSRLRATQATMTKQHGGIPQPAWIGTPNPVHALQGIIRRKIEKATTYDSGRYDELWLLIAAALPDPVAVAPTMIFLPPDPATLNVVTDTGLCGSGFAKVYLHVILQHWLFMWSRATRWQQI